MRKFKLIVSIMALVLTGACSKTPTSPTGSGAASYTTLYSLTGAEWEAQLMTEDGQPTPMSIKILGLTPAPGTDITPTAGRPCGGGYFCFQWRVEASFNATFTNPMVDAYFNLWWSEDGVSLQQGVGSCNHVPQGGSLECASPEGGMTFFTLTPKYLIVVGHYGRNGGHDPEPPKGYARFEVNYK